jgi:hypothetical protein
MTTTNSTYIIIQNTNWKYFHLFYWKNEFLYKHLPQVTDKLYHKVLYQVHLALAGIELITLVVVGTDYIGSSKIQQTYAHDHGGP